MKTEGGKREVEVETARVRKTESECEKEKEKKEAFAFVGRESTSEENERNEGGKDT